MFTTTLDFETIAGSTSALVVIVTTTTALLGFTIKKIFHIMKG